VVPESRHVHRSSARSGRIVARLPHHRRGRNTFGTIWQIRDALELIDAGTPTSGLEEGLRERLRRVLTTIEDNRALFAIPEKHLIDNVYRAAGRIRKKVGA
jgi:hypothetical protein